MTVLWISVFGLIGVLSRYGLDKAVTIQENSFPWATLITNVLGCALAGLIYVFAEKEMISPNLQVALLVGFCGGFSTFSAYALQTLMMFERSKAGPALLYFLVSPTLGILTAFIAVTLARKII